MGPQVPRGIPEASCLLVRVRLRIAAGGIARKVISPRVNFARADLRGCARTDTRPKNTRKVRRATARLSFLSDEARCPPLPPREEARVSAGGANRSRREIEGIHERIERNGV